MTYPALTHDYDEPAHPRQVAMPPAPRIRDRHIAFVRHYVELGGTPTMAPQAAMLAGLATPSDPEGRLAAAMLLEHPPVARAIRSELAQRFLLHAGEVLGTLLHLVRSARSEAVRLAAAKELLDRSIGPIVSRSAVVSADVPVEDLLAAIRGGSPEAMP